MTQEHLTELAFRFPASEGKRVLLRAFEKGAEPVATAADLEDPIGEPVEVYRDQLQVIRQCVDHLRQNLDRRLRGSG